jgi:hypothetical protein
VIAEQGRQAIELAKEQAKHEGGLKAPPKKIKTKA